MALVSRYPKELVKQYQEQRHWDGKYPIDYWEANALLRPTEEALIYHTERFTWQSAVKTAYSLATGFLNSGLKKNDILALQGSNSALLFLVRLAAEKAGIITLLIPPGFSKREISSISDKLTLAGVVLGNDKKTQTLLPFYEELSDKKPIRIYTIGDFEFPRHQKIDSWVDCQNSSLRLKSFLSGNGFLPFEYATIITTSGTTGLPQLVENPACARTASGRVYIERLQLTSKDVILGTVSIFSGNCDLLTYYTAAQAGAKIVLIKDCEPASICRAIEEEKVSCAVFVPTLLHRLLAYKNINEYDLSTLRIVTCFGALLAPELAAKVENSLKVKIIQGYGASDYGSIACTAINDPKKVRLAGVGRPLSGTDLRICNNTGELVTSGTKGSIFVRGPHAVGGFINESSLFEQKWKTGFFDVGDIGSLDNDGYLWLAGRSREIIIRGSQNIVPVEVEGAILEHPDVLDVAVIGVADHEMGERVCAFLVLNSAVMLSLPSLRVFLQKKGLAFFKLPEFTVKIDRLPLNPAGNKVDKNRLQQDFHRILQGRKTDLDIIDTIIPNIINN
ncbi:MAG: fatty acid--CoA ligase family protein [Candidatus Cloacimonetes bacterium]|nr:fatty acid--CoA ligase family protein [Candidatus Cloacimonadota bacterium]